MAIYKEVGELLKAMDTWDKYGVSFGLFRLNESDKNDYVPYVRYEDMVQAVTGTPHADVAPVIHAHWIVNEHGQPYCSNCNEVFLPYVLTEYCPHCGAIMDEKGEG